MNLYIIAVYDNPGISELKTNLYAVAAETMAVAEDMAIERANDEGSFEQPEIDNSLSFEVTTVSGADGLMHDVHVGTGWR